VFECDQAKINNLDTYCEPVEEVRATKRNDTDRSTRQQAGCYTLVINTVSKSAENNKLPVLTEYTFTETVTECVRAKQW
jgi:hypothetical protein